MTTIMTTACPLSQPAPPGLWARLLNFVADWHEQRALAEAEDRLKTMDDHLLRDIGIERSEAHSAAYDSGFVRRIL